MASYKQMTLHKEPAGGFWTYDTAYESPYAVPSTDELANAWQKHHEAKDILALDQGMFGVCELPLTQPTTVISLDLCEVLRETGLSLTRMNIETETDTVHDYGMFYGDGILGEDSQRAREALLPEFMHHEQVPPMPYAEAITAFMLHWRESGAYIIANTSTLPGCELSTVRFLSQQYPGTIQGILLPRNHDGNGTTTKAGILQRTKEIVSVATGFDLSSIPTLAIEDAYHHGAGYIEHPNESHVFMPAYSWNSPLESHSSVTRVEQQFGTLDTFIAVDEYLRSCGIVK